MQDSTVLEKKLQRSEFLNVILSILLGLFVLATLIAFIVFSIIYSSIKPHINALMGSNLNIASVSAIMSEKSIDINKFSTKLAFLDDIINLLYYYDKDNEKLEDAMFDGYMKALGDKYAEYYTVPDFHDFTEKTTEGVYYGIGCLVNQDLDNNDCIVSSVYDGSPADIGGLKKDDIFVSVNGEYVRGIALNELISKIRGEDGAKRIIEVFRPSVNDTIELTVYCGKVDIILVDSEIYENDIGYITINEFTGKAVEQFKKEIDNLINKNVKGLIIDLRDNPGGELMTVCEIMDYILMDNDGKYTLNQKNNIFDEGKTLLVYIKEKDKIVDAAYCDDKHSVELPIVILTNINTASAAELFTECMRDYNKAQVVGIKTYGKGVVQNIIPYEDGSAFKFTVSEYFPPSGYSINMDGILPDYSLDYNGEEVLYDEDNNILLEDDNKIISIDREGNIVNENLSTRSDTSFIASDSEIKKVDNNLSVNSSHKDSLKIYDQDNKFINEDWYAELNNQYDDKQLLQAIVVLKESIKN